MKTTADLIETPFYGYMDADAVNRIYDETRAHWIAEALKRLASNPDYISLITKVEDTDNAQKARWIAAKLKLP